MEVTCERCSTEYEFDDALVSEKGTTVKCTNCGHKFKVQREGGASIPERWVVRTVDGRELEYTALRELQSAIGQGKIRQDDVLSRGSGRPRRLGSISELGPFFESAKKPGASTQLGVGGNEPVRINTSRPAGAAVPPPASALSDNPEPRQVSAPPPGQRVGLDSDMPERRSKSFPPPLPAMGSDRPPLTPLPAPLPRPPRSPRMDSSAPPPPPTGPANPRSTFTNEASGPESRLSVPGQRRTAAGPIVAVIAFVAAIGVAFIVGKRFMAPAPSASGATTEDDGRISRLVQQARSSLAEGDLDSAKEALDKASVLKESDANVLRMLAQVGLLRAETAWLHGRMVESTHPDRAVLDRETATAINRVREAIGAAKKAAPADASITRFELDALRIAGQRPGARELVAKIPGADQDADSAFSIAALDMLEEKPDWTLIVKRLRQAAAVEKNLGRARSTLVVALAASGDVAAARTELDALVAAPHAHPLIPFLRALLDRGVKTTLATSASAPLMPSDLPALPNDRELVRMAYEARAAGDLRGAEKLFQQALKMNPANTDARAGLDDTLAARARENPGTSSKPAGRGGKAKDVEGRVPDDYVWTPPADDKPAATTP